MERRLLELQADQIEMVLSHHKVPSRVLGGMVTPRTVRWWPEGDFSQPAQTVEVTNVE